VHAYVCVIYLKRARIQHTHTPHTHTHTHTHKKVYNKLVQHFANELYIFTSPWSR